MITNGKQNGEIAHWVQRLTGAEAALHELTDGQIDSVVTAEGDTFLLRQAQEALQKSEARFRALIENSWDAVSLWSGDGIFQYSSPAVTRMLGYSPADLAGCNCFGFVHPDDRELFQVRFTESLEKPGVGIGSYQRVRHADGSWRLVECMITNLLDDSNVGAIVNNFRDATEREHARQELERIFDLSLDMICTAGFDGYFKQINPAFERILGYTHEELTAESFLSFVHPDDRDATIAAAEQLAVGRDVLLFDNRYRCKDGSYRWLQWSSKSLPDEQLIYAVTRDITERKQAAAALENLRRQNDLILQSVGEGVWGIDVAGRISFENPIAAKMLGWDAHELIGRDAHETMHHSRGDGCCYPREECAVHATLHDGVVRRINNEVFWRKDGTCFPVEYVSTPMRDEGGAIVGAVVTFRDVTEQLAAEREVRSAKARLQHFLSSSPAVLYAVKLQSTEPRFLQTWISDNVAAIMGYSAEEALADPMWWLDHIHPDDHNRVLAEYYAAAEKQDLFTLEYRFRRKDGTYFWMRDEIRLLRDDSGAPCEFVGACSDLTEQKKAEAAQRAQEEHYRLLFEKSPSPMSLFDRNSLQFLDVNEAAIRHLGYSREEFLHSTIQDICLPEEIPLLLASVALVTPEAPRVGLRRLRKKDGGIVLMDLCSIAITLNGKAGLLAIGTDVTEREQAQERLRQSEAALALAQHVARVGSWEIDLANAEDGASTPLSWSDETYRIFGYERGEIEVTTDTFYQRVHPADRASVANAFAAMARTGMRYSIDYRIVLPNGAERIVHAEATMIVDDESGRALKVVGTSQDITERKLAEEVLREQAELLEMAHDAIMVRGLDTCIRLWNRGAESIYGWTAAEAIGRNAAELLYIETDLHHEAMRGVLKNGNWSGELRQVTKAGMPVVVNSRWTLMRDAAGEPKSVLVINSDITEHKKLQTQFLRAQRLESIGTLASGVAHDLNNILAPILMAAPILRNELSAKSREAILNTIETCAERGADIVRQVLTFARGVEGERLLVDSTHLLKEMGKIAQETFPKSIDVRVSYPKTSWLIEGDPTQLHQVILNLCVNARDAMPDGGELLLSVENLGIDEQFAAMMPGAKPGPHIVIQVRDTGTGIPRGVVDQIFDPFFTTKEMGKGTGLGLSTAMGIVKSHGGFINVYSEVGRGTTFKVFLPASPSAQASAAKEQEETPPHGNGELLLIIDDERSIREVVQTILERHGYRVMVAADGPEALAIFALRMGEIRAVLTDLMLPIMDGISVIRALRKMQPTIRIVASTGRADEKRLHELNALDVPVCLTKPYNQKKLLFTLRDVLGRPNQ
ncbi:MAG: PAS domain S-box protein [Verrucomicrobia bacterium]|nr:PAS domain S-box protein [Verrucomicrobiota bacterium]